MIIVKALIITSSLGCVEENELFCIHRCKATWGKRTIHYKTLHSGCFRSFGIERFFQHLIRFASTLLFVLLPNRELVCTINELEDRVTKLEQVRYGCKVVDDSIRRARGGVEASRNGMYSSSWKWVPTNYYDQSLEKRSQILGAASIRQLCKSLVLENREWKEEKVSSGNKNTNPQFVMVVIQYAASLDVKKLITAIRSLRPAQNRLDSSNFDFRVASAQDNDRLTGYSHNSVTPFGLLANKEDLPIVLDSAIVAEGFFWMGGGHVHLKLGLSVSDFIESTQSIVASISQPRTENMEEN